jgi:hypothetical protein
MESWERPQKSEMLTSQTSNFNKVEITHSTGSVDSLHFVTSIIYIFLPMTRYLLNHLNRKKCSHYSRIIMRGNGRVSHRVSPDKDSVCSKRGTTLKNQKF